MSYIVELFYDNILNHNNNKTENAGKTPPPTQPLAAFPDIEPTHLPVSVGGIHDESDDIDGTQSDGNKSESTSKEEFNSFPDAPQRHSHGQTVWTSNKLRLPMTAGLNLNVRNGIASEPQDPQDARRRLRSARGSKPHTPSFVL